MLKLSRTERGGLAVVTIGGRLDAESRSDLENELREIIDSGISRILVDMEKLSYISSAGIALILSVRKELSKSGFIALARLQPFVVKVFEAAELNDVLVLLGTEDEMNRFIASESAS